MKKFGIAVAALLLATAPAFAQRGGGGHGGGGGGFHGGGGASTVVAVSMAAAVSVAALRWFPRRLWYGPRFGFGFGCCGGYWPYYDSVWSPYYYGAPYYPYYDYDYGVPRRPLRRRSRATMSRLPNRNSKAPGM